MNRSKICRWTAITVLLILLLACCGCGLLLDAASGTSGGEEAEATPPVQTAAAQIEADAAGEDQLAEEDLAEQAQAAFAVVGEQLNIEADQELVPLASGPALPVLLLPVASGTLVSANSKASIDYSNTADGYVMVKYNTASAKKLKLLLTGPSGVTYTYDLNGAGSYDAFPLSDGSGSYSLGVYENISGASYATAHTATIQVALKDEFAPFLLPNQYVNYSATSQTVLKAAELTQGKTSVLSKVEAIYSFVISNISYDYEKAKTVTSGYLPAVDSILSAKKGICFDYAAVMAAMLRSQAIPTKLVVGYSGTAYHAWINIYAAESGWINGVVFFDGVQWKLMDPTYAANANQSAAIMEYIGNNANYTAKYLY